MLFHPLPCFVRTLICSNVSTLLERGNILRENPNLSKSELNNDSHDYPSCTLTQSHAAVETWFKFWQLLKLKCHIFMSTWINFKFLFTSEAPDCNVSSQIPPSVNWSDPGTPASLSTRLSKSPSSIDKCAWISHKHIFTNYYLHRHHLPSHMGIINVISIITIRLHMISTANTAGIQHHPPHGNQQKYLWPAAGSVWAEMRHQISASAHGHAEGTATHHLHQHHHQRHHHCHHHHHQYHQREKRRKTV